MKGSLRWKIVAGSLLVQMVVVLVLLAISVNQISQTLVRQAHERVAEVSQLLNRSLAPLVVSEDYSGIDALMSSLLHDGAATEGGLRHLIVLDRGGREIARKGWSLTALPPVVSEIDPWGDNTQLSIATPLTIAGEAVGELRFGVGTAFIVDARERLVAQALVLVGLLLVVSAVGLTLLGNWLTGPLLRLQDATRQLAAGGKPAPLLITNRDEVGELARTFDAMSRQLTARVRELSDSEARMRAIFDQSAFGKFLAGLDRRVLRVNEPFAKATGRSMESLIGIDFPSLFAPAQVVDIGATATLLVNGELATFERVLPLMRPGGAQSWARLHLTVMRDAERRPEYLLGMIEDVTASRAAEDRIRQLAFFDALTGLPNRSTLYDRLHLAMRASGAAKRHCALMMLNLDGFKIINDSQGHEAGDRVLVAMAQRLRRAIGPADTAARVGSDEFAVLLEGIPGEPGAALASAREVAVNILHAIAEPLRLGDAQVEQHQTVSIGLVIFSGEQPNAETLLKQADLALQSAKSAGRNTVQVFDPAMQAAINARVLMQAQLRQALQGNEFRLHLQPQLDTSGRVIGAEALLRWHTQDGAAVAPSVFVPVAEESSLIVPIGHWVIDEACRVLARWQQQPLLRGLKLSVNVSAREFRQSDFVERLSAAVRSAGVSSHRLCLELTESMLVDNMENTIERMHELRALGFQFSLDDFGTGFSSLSYLKRLPLNQIKIDQSFVRDICVDDNDAAIVGAITAMGHSLGLQVVAEGVETPEQRLQLIGRGCGLFQGWLYCAALTTSDFERWVGERNTGPTTAVAVRA